MSVMYAYHQESIMLPVEDVLAAKRLQGAALWDEIGVLEETLRDPCMSRSERAAVYAQIDDLQADIRSLRRERAAIERYIH